MSICAVNGQVYEPAAGLKTWEQLLDALEHGAGPERIVVTAVRFDGVDQPSFREAEVLARNLDAGTCVDVDTSRARVLVDEAVDAALNGLGPLALAAQHTAVAFRRHDLDDAHVRLAGFVGTLQTLTTLTAAVIHAAATPHTASADATATLIERLSRGLESLITMATNEDWTSVADVLEYDIADLLPVWRAALLALAGPASGADRDPISAVELRYAS